MALEISASATVRPDEFVHVGPGTVAGRYLRSFWQPIAMATDVKPGRALPLRMFGEDFTLYRGQTASGDTPLPNPPPQGGRGNVHLVAFRCAHRGTQLSTGWVEGEEIRCFYHGWKYDGSGVHGAAG